MMRIRNKILAYFSTTVVLFFSLAMLAIYFLFSEYREEEFQQRQKNRIEQTVQFLSKYRETTEDIKETMDKLTIHDLYDEKIIIYDQDKDLIYASVDDLNISKNKQILNNLSPSKRWIETKEEKYDVIGIYFETDNHLYYGISKAYDNYGFSKLIFLRNTLIGLFFGALGLVFLVSVYLSKKIAKPISELAEKMSVYHPENKQDELKIQTTTFELNYLVSKFNELLGKTNEAFVFQKYAIQHISHELKTPIAILVSELERISIDSELPNQLKKQVNEQVQKAKSLGDIIHILLEISKIESGQNLFLQTTRLDEMIFDVIEEFQLISPEFVFEIAYLPEIPEEKNLQVSVNKMLVTQVLRNIMSNCIQYSDGKIAQVLIDCSSSQQLKVQFVNSGKIIEKEEVKFLFEHFFRGENSRGKSGFGLGLVLSRKIMDAHRGKIEYTNPNPNSNVFELTFPLK